MNNLLCFAIGLIFGGTLGLFFAALLMVGHIHKEEIK